VRDPEARSGADLKRAGFHSVALLCVAACATPAVAQRRLDLGVTATALYDSNVARANDEQALARGLVQEDFRFTPAATLDMFIPAVGRHGVFANGFAGYDFYARNTRLNRERIELRSGLNLRFAQCRSDIFGSLSRRQSELGDITLGPTDNSETLRSVTFEGRCERPTGLNPRFSLFYEEGRNSEERRRRSNLDRFRAEAGLGYSNVALGTFGIFGRYQDARFPERPFLIGGMIGEDGFEAYTVGVSYERQIGTALRGLVEAGYITVEPDRPDLPQFDGLTARAELLFNPLGRLTGRLEAAREVDSSNRIDVSYFVENRIQGSLEYRISPATIAEAGLAYRDREFEGASQSDLSITQEETKSVFAALTMQLTPKVSLRFEAEHEERTTDNDLFDYQSTQLGVTTALKF
jgi:hypothetical protein